MGAGGLRSRVYRFATDCYSFGMLLWEILADGELPFNEHTNLIDLSMKILSENLRPTLNESWDDAVIQLMEQLWSTDPTQRPVMADVYSALETRANDMAGLDDNVGQSSVSNLDNMSIGSHHSSSSASQSQYSATPVFGRREGGGSEYSSLGGL